MADIDPRYTDQQMALILKRAAEMQAAGEEPVHTIAAIQQIAEQVGIDRHLVAEAAASLPAVGSGVAASLFGAPSEYRLTRRLSGALEAGERASVVATIRDHMPSIGVATETAQGIEWHSGPADNKTAITLTRADRETVVRIDGRYHGPKAMLYLGAGLVTGVTAALGVASHSPALGLGLGLGALAASFTGARLLWNGIAARSRRRAELLVEALAKQLGPS